MLRLRGVPSGFLIVTLVSVGAATFRVATAPDRIRENRALAHKTCVSSGGDWARVGQTEICRKPDGGWLSGP